MLLVKNLLLAYCNAVIEPWDGPAAVCGNFGDWIISGMDRNGLRPLRYILTNDGLLISGSEVGMINIEEKNILKKGRVGPGELVAHAVYTPHKRTAARAANDGGHLD